jgi:starch synthase (maltosyl-transferring)
MIGEVRARHPDAIFLAEAFTRPKVMKRLAKVGFNQSYSYFTWRNTKAEITEYMTVLTASECRDYMRPNFFVNTPDINPFYLQTSGRAGFQVRAVLAATLAGNYGVYSGFELCEAEPIPGKEEYLNSEKYEIRAWDWDRPGHIRPDIRLLNKLRREHPALQAFTNLKFYNAWNDNILYYGKATPGMDDYLLFAVNLDPHNSQHADFEVPLWEFGLPDESAIAAEDLVTGAEFTWQGKIQHMLLDPHERPYCIWRLIPPGRHI